MIVDDHELVRNALVMVLAEEEDLDVVGTAGSIAEAIDVATTSSPDIVLMDYRLPDGDGATGTRELRRALPVVRVIMLTARDDPTTRARAVAAGCTGFVSKGAKLDSIASAVRAAASAVTDQPFDAD